jgi:hypothetical protein
MDEKKQTSSLNNLSRVVPSTFLGIISGALIWNVPYLIEPIISREAEAAELAWQSLPITFPPFAIIIFLGIIGGFQGGIIGFLIGLAGMNKVWQGGLCGLVCCFMIWTFPAGCLVRHSSQDAKAGSILFIGACLLGLINGLLVSLLLFLARRWKILK